jgi:hypothetical protein
MLIYTGKGPVGKELPIAIVRPREKGIGFRGVVGLEFKATPLFACAAAKANKNIEQTNSVNDEIANSKICNK